MEGRIDGTVVIHPISEEIPLHLCNHVTACTPVNPQGAQGEGIEAKYLRRGMAILGTVADGDCGVDTASIMIGLPQTAEHRNELRQETSWVIYLITPRICGYE